MPAHSEEIGRERSGIRGASGPRWRRRWRDGSWLSEALPSETLSWRRILASLGLAGTPSAPRGARNTSPWGRDALIAAGVALAYLLGAEFAFSVGVLSWLFAPLWPPNIILLCALLMSPYRRWWQIIAAVLPAHLAAEAIVGMALAPALGAFFCNVSFALGAAYGLRRFAKGPPWLASLAGVRTYIVLTGFVVPGTVALMAAASGLVTGDRVGCLDFAWRWYLGNLVGALTLGPLLIVCIGNGLGWLRQSSTRNLAKIAMVFGSVAAAAYFGFAFTRETAQFLSLPYIVVPPLLWATVQFGMRGATGAIGVVTLLSIAGAMRGLGPFAALTPDETIVALQIFLAVLSAPFLVLAAGLEERHRALADIHVAERKLQSILDNTPACISMRDIHGRYILANRAARERAPLPEDYVGKSYDELFPEATAARFHADDAAAIQSNEPITKEEVVEFTERQHVYLSSKFAVRAEDGSVHGICTIATDITEHKQSVDALEASEAKFRVMAETVPAILFTADRHGNWEYASQRFFDFSGLSADIPIIPDWTNLIHPGDLPRVRTSWRRSITMGEPFIEELRIRAAAGSYFWFAARCRPIRGPTGQIERWFGVAFEIDEMKTIERDLRVANATQSAILDGISDGYYTLDEALRITSMNAKAGRDAGLDPQDAIGRSLLDVFPHLRGTKLVTACRRALRRRIALQLEMEVPQSDEQWLDISIYTAENGISVFTRDVSERKRAESALYTLSSRLLNLQDEERRRIARELHDGTAQNVMAVLLNLARVSSKLPEPDEDGRRLVAESTALIEQSLAEIRTLSYWLHPPLLDEAGLLPTLRWYVDGFMKRSGIKIDLHVASANLHLRPEVEMTLFRVVQECLGNVHRHSGASAAIIHLSHNPKQTALTVTDNGHGGTIRGTLEDANDINSLGVGLAGMNARLKQLGGHLKIVSSRQGTSVQAVIGNVVPIPGDHREATWSSSVAPGSEPLRPRSLKSRAGAIDDGVVERRDSTDPQVEGRISAASRGGRNEMGIAAPSAPSDS